MAMKKRSSSAPRGTTTPGAGAPADGSSADASSPYAPSPAGSAAESSPPNVATPDAPPRESAAREAAPREAAPREAAPPATPKKRSSTGKGPARTGATTTAAPDVGGGTAPNAGQASAQAAKGKNVKAAKRAPKSGQQPRPEPVAAAPSKAAVKRATNKRAPAVAVPLTPTPAESLGGAEAPPADVSLGTTASVSSPAAPPSAPVAPPAAPVESPSERADDTLLVEAAAEVDVDESPATPAVESSPQAYPLLTPSGEPVSVVHLVAELAPFARTGGLGEASANLALHQVSAGLNVALIMPLYRQVQDVVNDFVPVSDPFAVVVGPRTEYAQLFESESLRARTAEGKPRVFFLANGHYFDREGIYGDSRGDYGDNARRWAHFSLGALTGLPRVIEGPVLLHTHDWHTALAPAYLRAYQPSLPFYRNMWNVMTVHNAGFQGHFPTDTMADIGMPWEYYNVDMFEWYGRMNMLKGGMACADAVTTVSPTHAHELRTPAGGFGLHDHFIAQRERFLGIVNGIDLRDWNPATDPNLVAHFSRTDLGGKRQCKAALQRHFGIPERPGTPIIGMSARMVAQKGLDLILSSPRFLSLDAQFIFLGQGERRYVDLLGELARMAPERIGVQTRFTVEQEHVLLAGADMIVMPSQYEPCGLTQMRAQRYGTIPVARRVGGLADTIDDNVTGFLFDEYTQDDFIQACARAIDHYRHPQTWTAMVREAMRRDFGWERSEVKYRDLYRQVIASPRWRR